MNNKLQYLLGGAALMYSQGCQPTVVEAPRPAPPPMSSEQFQALSRAPHGTSLPEAQVLERIRRQNQRLNAKIF